MKIVVVYASVLALFFVFLSIRTIRIRRRLKIAVGDSGNQKMLRAIRVHANFAEYTPFSLLLIAFAEFKGPSPILIHFLCLVLLAGRISHAFGVSQEPENFRFRIAGMLMTFAVLILTSGFLLIS